jgi:hypothetical protein
LTYIDGGLESFLGSILSGLCISTLPSVSRQFGCVQLFIFCGYDSIIIQEAQEGIESNLKGLGEFQYNIGKKQTLVPFMMSILSAGSIDLTRSCISPTTY